MDFLKKKLKIPYLFFFYFLAIQTLRIKIHCSPKKKKKNNNNNNNTAYMMVISQEKK